MHVVGHRSQLDDFRPMFGADLADDLVQTLVHWIWVALDGWIGDLGVVVIGTDSDHICTISTELCIA